MAAPIPMSRPVEEDSPLWDWSPDAATEEAAPAAGSVEGAGGHSEGVDGRVQLGERPDGSVVEGEEGVFDVAFDQGVIGRGDRGSLVADPQAGGVVGDDQWLIKVLFGGACVAVRVDKAIGVNVESAEGNSFEGCGDLVEVGHGRAHLHVPGFVQGIERIAPHPCNTPRSRRSRLGRRLRRSSRVLRPTRRC